MISEGRARELARIRTVIMLACPNGGSQYLASVRHVLGYGRHPQAANLEVLNKQITDTQRAVLTRIVHASGVDDHQCRIPFHVYAGGSDAIVPAALAQAAFPGAGTLAGNHFTIQDPTAPGNRTADIVKHHILADIPEGPPASAHGAAPAIPAKLAGHGQPGVSLSQAQGVQVGDRNVQHNVFSSPPVRPRDAATPRDDPNTARASMTPLKMELIDEEWVFIQDTIWAFAILVQVENKTDKAILVTDSHFTNLDDGDRNTPLYQRYRDIWPEVRRETEYLSQAHLNDGYSGIFEPNIVFSPNRQEALWYVGDALPPEGGGRPQFIFTMIDSLGNSYEMEIDRRPAKRFRLRTDTDPEALPAMPLCLASGVGRSVRTFTKRQEARNGQNGLLPATVARNLVDARAVDLANVGARSRPWSCLASCDPSSGYRSPWPSETSSPTHPGIDSEDLA
jgi:hypothetical protein